VAGSPVDQFSFFETETDNLNVLVRSGGTGEQMWDSEVSAGDIALLRLNADDFADGSASAGTDKYLDLPKTRGLHIPKSLCRRLPALRHGQRLGTDLSKRTRQT
jgi:hypothetical protein